MRKIKLNPSKSLDGSSSFVKAFSNQTVKTSSPIRYTDSKGTEVRNINDWYSIFKSSRKESHWKDGRSAKSLADFMMNGHGQTFIRNIVRDLLKEDVSFENAIPECEMRFDNYGHGREHDLAIWGTTASNKKVFIGIEAKVDEPFNETIGDAYISAKIRELNGKETNAPQRIEELLKRHFKQIKPEYFKLRYQLFYATAGTLAAKADISIMLIIVFETNLYNKVIGIKNYNDYIRFINSINSNRIFSNTGIDIHELQIGESSLYSIYVNIDRTVEQTLSSHSI
jgi:hypothetical protein